FDFAERYCNLAIVRVITNNGPDYLFEFIYPFDFSTMTPEALRDLPKNLEAAMNRWDRQMLRAPLVNGISRCAMLALIDFNEMCRAVNEAHDAIVAELRQPDARLRARRFRELGWLSDDSVNAPRLPMRRFKQ